MLITTILYFTVMAVTSFKSRVVNLRWLRLKTKKFYQSLGLFVPPHLPPYLHPSGIDCSSLSAAESMIHGRALSRDEFTEYTVTLIYRGCRKCVERRWSPAPGLKGREKLESVFVCFNLCVFVSLSLMSVSICACLLHCLLLTICVGWYLSAFVSV